MIGLGLRMKKRGSWKKESTDRHKKAEGKGENLLLFVFVSLYFPDFSSEKMDLTFPTDIYLWLLMPKEYNGETREKKKRKLHQKKFHSTIILIVKLHFPPTLNFRFFYCKI